MNREQRLGWLGAAGLLALASAFAWPLLREGVYVGNGTDLFSYQLPTRALVRRLLLAGELPLWNDGVLGGLPLHGAWQLGLLDPVTLLTIALPPELSTDLDRALRGVVLLTGGLALGNVVAGVRDARALLQPSAAGLASAGLLGGAGVTWGHVYAGHVSFLAAWSYAPWWIAGTLWSVSAGHAAGARLRGALWAGVALGLCLLAGHPQVVYVSGVALVFAAAAQALTGGGVRGAGDAIWVGALVLAVGVGLAAAQLLPVWSLAPELNRALETRDGLALSFSPPVAALLTGPAPLAFGAPELRASSFSWHEAVGGISPGLWALACVAAATRGGGARVAVVAGLGLLTLIPGKNLSVLPALLDWVPGLDAFRVPSRWWVATTLLMAIGAASTVARWWPVATDRRAPADTAGPERFGAAVAGLFALVLFGLAFTLSEDTEWLRLGFANRADSATRSAALAALGGRLALAGLLAGAVAAAALRPSLRRPVVTVALLFGAYDAVQLAREVQPETRQWPMARLSWDAPTRAALQARVGRAHRLVTAPQLRHADRPGGAGVMGAGGYETAMPLWSNRWGNLANGRPRDRYQVNLQIRRDSPWLDRMAASHLLRPAGDPRTGRTFAGWRTTDRLGALELAASPTAMPRFALARGVEVEPDRQRALERLGRLDRGRVLVDRAVNVEPADVASNVALIEERNDAMALQVQTAAPALLVARDVLLPGWEARIDQTAQDLVLVDGLFRGVVVPAGSHRVELRYRAPGLALGAGISVATLALVVAGLWLGRRSERAAST